MGKKPKKISAKKMFTTTKISKMQTKTKKKQSNKIKTKKPIIKDKEKKVKIKKMKRIPKKTKKQREEEEEEELIEQLYEDYNEFPDYYVYENDIENMPHDKFDIYEVPTTIKENEEYLKKLIDESDIILELLDARDIYYSLDKKIEKFINNDKLLIYVINKIDLVSQNYIKKMANQLSKETNKKYPILFTSCLIREKIKELYDNILTEISKFKSGIKTPKKKTDFIKVGILGMPNVGKNSLIQSFELLVNSNCDDKFIFFEDNKIFCINSVPATLYGTNENNYLISKKYKNVEDIPNPISLLNNLFKYIDENTIKEIYGFGKKPENLQNFIACLKKKYGMKSEKQVQQQILRDIICGKIFYEVN